MGDRVEVTYYGETYSVSPKMLENIEKGEMTEYTGQCRQCVCFTITKEEKAADIYLHAWCNEKCIHCHSLYKHTLIAGLLGEIAELKGIEREKRSGGKHFGLFEKKWYILFEVLYKRAKSDSLGKISRTSKAKLYRTGYALLYAAVAVDKETFNTTAKAEGISKETAEQAYQYILQNPPSEELVERSKKRGLNNLSFDW